MVFCYDAPTAFQNAPRTIRSRLDVPSVVPNSDASMPSPYTTHYVGCIVCAASPCCIAGYGVQAGWQGAWVWPPGAPARKH